MRKRITSAKREEIEREQEEISRSIVRPFDVEAGLPVSYNRPPYGHYEDVLKNPLTVKDSGIFYRSLMKSRLNYINVGPMFRLYWLKQNAYTKRLLNEKSRRHEVNERIPVLPAEANARDVMVKLSDCTMTIGPHSFEIKLFIGKDERSDKSKGKEENKEKENKEGTPEDTKEVREDVSEEIPQDSKEIPQDTSKEISEDTPKEDTPKEDTPKEETPKEETPKEETPKEETPKEDTPKESTPKESTPQDSPMEEDTPIDSPKETPLETPKETPKENTPKEDTPKPSHITSIPPQNPIETSSIPSQSPINSQINSQNSFPNSISQPIPQPSTQNHPPTHPPSHPSTHLSTSNDSPSNDPEASNDSMQSPENLLMISNLNAIARVDPTLNTLMKIVARGTATPNQIMTFQGYISRAREMGPPPHPFLVPNMRINPHQPLRVKKVYKDKKPYKEKKPIKFKLPRDQKLTAFQEKYLSDATLVFEYAENSNVRYMLPKNAICEVLPSKNSSDERDILISFLWVHNQNELSRYEELLKQYNDEIQERERKEKEEEKKKIEAENETKAETQLKFNEQESKSTSNEEIPPSRVTRSRPNTKKTKKPPAPKQPKKLEPPIEPDLRYTSVSFVLHDIPSKFVPIVTNSVYPEDKVREYMLNILSKGTRSANFYLWYQVDAKLDEQLAENVRSELVAEERKMPGIPHTSSTVNKKRKV